MYCIPCKCDHVYTRQTVQSIETKERAALAYCLGQPYTLCIAQYSFNREHCFQLQDTKSWYRDCVIMDLIEVHPNNMDGRWPCHEHDIKPLNHSLQEWRKFPHVDTELALQLNWGHAHPCSSLVTSSYILWFHLPHLWPTSLNIFW